MKTAPYVVLVGMDFSEPSNRALAEAFELTARRPDAELHVVFLVAPPTAETSLIGAGDLPNSVVEPLESAFERLQTHVQERLEAFISQAGEHGKAITGRVVSHVHIDTPALGLVQFASDLQASLIVIGTHGRSGISRLLLGSIAETTVRHARCPLLVVPAEVETAKVVIEAPCSECLRTRADPESHELWCAQHRERHGRRHTYHQSDRGGGETNFPLVVQ